MMTIAQTALYLLTSPIPVGVGLPLEDVIDDKD